MSFIQNIDFYSSAQGHSLNQHSTSPGQERQRNSHEPGSPVRQSREASPNQDEGQSGRNLEQLRSHAIVTARRDRLPATAEERLVDFSQARQQSFSLLYSHDSWQLPFEEKLIDLSSKISRIEQRVERFEASTNECQTARELPSIPKHIMVSLFYKPNGVFTDARRTTSTIRQQFS